jgi:hypothetical protein
MEIAEKHVAVVSFRALESFKKIYSENFPESEIFDLINS